MGVGFGGQGALSSQALCHSPSSLLPFPCSRKTCTTKPGGFPIPGPQPSEPRALPAVFPACCFGHPGPRRSRNPDGARVTPTSPHPHCCKSHRISISYNFPSKQSRAQSCRRKAAEAQMKVHPPKSVPSCSPKRKSSGTSAKCYAWYFNSFSYLGSVWQPAWRGASASPGQPGHGSEVCDAAG